MGNFVEDGKFLRQNQKGEAILPPLTDLQKESSILYQTYCQDLIGAALRLGFTPSKAHEESVGASSVQLTRTALGTFWCCKHARLAGKDACKYQTPTNNLSVGILVALFH